MTREGVAMTGKQKKYLRGLAHDMKPLVQIGQRGLTDAVAGQVDAALTDHERIRSGSRPKRRSTAWRRRPNSPTACAVTLPARSAEC